MEDRKIVDEPHQIGDCSGRSFVVFDALSCRVTINGPDAMTAAKELISAFNLFLTADPPHQTQKRGDAE